MGKPRIPLAINLCINSVNIAGCAVVVFRPELFGGDAIFGVALANLFSQVAGLALAVFLLRGGWMCASVRDTCGLSTGMI